MDRWLFSFIQGALFSLFFTAQPSVFCIYLIIILGLGLLCLKKVRFFVAICLGISWVWLSAFQYQNIFNSNELAINSFISQPIFAKFIIQSIPAKGTKNYRFNALIVEVNERKVNKPIRVRLNWQLKEESQVSTKFIEPKQGQAWLAQIKIKPAHGYANPTVFSYQRWLREKDIHATGYVYRATSNKTQIIDHVVSLRQQLFDRIATQYQGNSLKGIVLALTFGERFLIDNAQWQILQRTNTSHLIAISGLHIGLIFMMAVVLVRLIVYCLTWLLSHLVTDYLNSIAITRLNIHHLSLVIGLFIAGFYAYLANFSMPTIRALVMLTIYVLSVVGSFQISRTRLVLVSVFIIVLIEPMAFISFSFWLSLTAVSTIFLVLWRTQCWRKNLAERFSLKFHLEQAQQRRVFQWCYSLVTIVVIQVALSLLLLPVTSLMQNQISTISFIANLIAVPWMSFVVIPAIFFHACLVLIQGTLALDISYVLEPILSFNHEVLHILWRYLHWLSELGFSSVVVSSQSWYFLVCLIIFVLSIGIFKGARFPIAVVSVFVVSIIFKWLMAPERNNAYWRLTTFDVGHGLSVLIEKQGKAILYDTGASYDNNFNFVDSVITPYLTHQGIQALDVVVLSHNDNDHNGGFNALLAKVSVEHVFTPYQIEQSHRIGEHINWSACQKGKVFQWQGLTIDVLSPKQLKSVSQALPSDNDNSCVIRISGNNQSVLLPGDISKRIEQELVGDKANTKLLNADVLIAPHHGSKTSSSTHFIETVSPDVVIFSTKYLNHWKMPHKDVVKRYQKEDIEIYNTASDGSVVVHFFGINQADNLVVETNRQHHIPYWFVN